MRFINHYPALKKHYIIYTNKNKNIGIEPHNSRATELMDYTEKYRTFVAYETSDVLCKMFERVCFICIRTELVNFRISIRNTLKNTTNRNDCN